MSRGPGCGLKWSIRRVDGLVHPCDHCIQMLELVVGLVVLTSPEGGRPTGPVAELAHVDCARDAADGELPIAAAAGALGRDDDPAARPELTVPGRDRGSVSGRKPGRIAPS